MASLKCLSGFVFGWALMLGMPGVGLAEQPAVSDQPVSERASEPDGASQSSGAGEELAEQAAAQQNAAEKTTATPDILLSEAVEDLLRQVKRADETEKTLDFYYALVDEKVSPFVDFPLIARRVMGKYYKIASDAQREAFVEVFRESLLMTYAKGIAGYTDQALVFLPFEGTQTQKGKTRAKVEMEIRTRSNEPVVVVYQMFLDPEDQWKLENLLLNGVNLGLTFRNQFSESYRQYGGDFAKVFANWSTGYEPDR